MPGMPIKIRRGSHISQSLRQAGLLLALRRKTFHEKGHLPDFSRRPERFILKHQRSTLD